MSNTPKLRFKEFSGEWESKKLGDLATIQRGSSPRPIADPKWFDENSVIGWVRISDVTSSNMYLEKVTQYLSEEGVKRSRFLEEPHLILSIAASVGKPIINKIPVCIHDGFIVFKDLNINMIFGYYFLKIAQYKWAKYKQPGTQFNLNSDLVSIMTIGVPSRQEQEKIAYFFSLIDKKIEKQSEKIKVLKDYKKGIMQKIFSREIRFKDEDGRDYPEWEEKRLRDIVLEKKKGKSIVYSEQGNILLNNEYMEGKSEPLYVENEIDVDQEDILILWDGSQAGKIYTGFTGVLGSTFLAIKLDENNNNLFVHQQLLSNLERIQTAWREGSGVPHIAKDFIDNFKINVPVIEEQKKISNILINIDNKIEKEQEKLDLLNQYKKGLLQQMFV